MKVLELFAGSKSIGKVANRLAFDVTQATLSNSVALITSLTLWNLT
jgi:hypothetical protein